MKMPSMTAAIVYIHIRYTLYTLKRQPSGTVIGKQKVNQFEGSELDFQASKFFLSSNPDFLTSLVFLSIQFPKIF